MFCTPPGIHCLVLHTLTAMDLDGGASFFVYSLVLDAVLTFGIQNIKIIFLNWVENIMTVTVVCLKVKMKINSTR